MSNEPIYVTRPHLPPLEEFIPYLEKIWANRILTNCGPLHQELEEKLCAHLGVPNISLFTNATIALVVGLQALNVTGEVITTPYSFVATSHALAWNRLKPVFVDIDPETLNIDVARIKAAITPRTSAILPVHCYGRPCDTEAIDEIAAQSGLKVIYDAAHAFGVECHCGSVLKHGDISILSFHATKVFNTFEGGAIISQTREIKEYIDRLKNFGFVNEIMVSELGINGKMSEVQAAFGLLQLRHLDEALSRRRLVCERYDARLRDIHGIRVPDTFRSARANYAYYPVLVRPDYGISRDELYDRLKVAGIHARRYFYPLISEFPIYRDLPSADPANLPVAHRVSREVLCLPLYPSLEISQVDRIADIVVECSAR